MRATAPNPPFAVLGRILAVAALCRLACASDPRPLSVPARSNFLGFDGQWSPVTIRVGAPPQWLSVFPSTLGQEAWVIGPGGCDGTPTCEYERGGLFFRNGSSTFESLGPYELGFDASLGDTGDGDYGLDDISISDGIGASAQILAVLNTTEFWLGELGLGVQQSRFADSVDHLSMISSLVQNQSAIPSHSYGYTAGAVYRLKNAPSSLTLGGVDTNRYTPNDASFTLSPNYAPVVAVNAITVSASPANAQVPPNWSSNSINLLEPSQAGLFTIDSSMPFFWFPEAVCGTIAAALNLTYDDVLQLYVFSGDTSSPDVLSLWNLTFSFALGNDLGSNSNIQITLPYDALNLQLTFPYPNLDANVTSLPTSYFPMKKAQSSNQYTIGRAFLQEAYLTVDYERNSFHISQASFNEATVGVMNLVPIHRPENSTWPGPQSSVSSSHPHRFPTAAKIGIAVGISIAAIAAIMLLWYLCVVRKRESFANKEQKVKRRSLMSGFRRIPRSNSPVPELLGDKRQPTEVAADSTNTRFELPGDSPVEMAGAEVPGTFLAANQDPRAPASRRRRNSMSKDMSASISERSSSPPVPPYSAADVPQPHSNSVGTGSPTARGFGTLSSGEPGISPIGSSPTSSQSNAMSSPISPEATWARTHMAPPSTSREPRIATGTPITLLLPLTQEQQPSRLGEEATESAEHPTVEQTEHPPARPARWSWEE